jgi:hypothetical protein
MSVGGANAYNLYPTYTNNPVYDGTNWDSIQSSYVNPNIIEINSQPVIQPERFTSGTYSFLSSTGNESAFIFNRCFFRIDAQLVVYDTPGVPATARQPRLTDGIAFARYWPGTLWSNINSSISSQNIDSITQFAPQSYALAMRMAYSGSVLDKDEDLFYSEKSFTKRQKKISQADGSLQNSAIPYYLGENADGLITTSIAPAPNAATDAVVTINLYNLSNTVTNLNYKTLLDIREGDIVSFGGLRTAAGIQPVVRGVVNNVIDFNPIPPALPNTYQFQITLTNPGAFIPGSYEMSSAATGRSGGFSIYRVPNLVNPRVNVLPAGEANFNQNSISAIYVPNIGLFQHGSPVSCDVKFDLTPNANYKYACVQTANNNMQPGRDYDVIINNMKLYTYVVSMNMSPERPLTMNLLEMTLSSLLLNSNNMQFTAPVGSRAFCVFFQQVGAGESGNGSVIAPDMFISADGSSTKIQTLQIKFNSIEQPRSNIITNFSNQTNTVSANGGVPQYVNGPADITNTINGTTAGTLLNPYQNTATFNYLNMLVNTGKIFSEAASESFQDYQNSPFYFFDYNNSKGSNATAVSIQVSFNGPLPANTNIFLASFHSVGISGNYSQNILTGLIKGPV